MASSFLARLIGLGADVVAVFERAIGGPVYSIHDYCEWVPLRGDMRFTRCSWTTPAVLRLLQGRGVTDVLNLCSERDDAAAVARAGMTPHRVPIDDGHPPDCSQLERISAIADGVVAANGRLAVHCEKGTGRTGCVAAFLLVTRYDWPAPTALANALRHGELTPEQRDFILALR